MNTFDKRQQSEKILNPFIFPAESTIRLWLCLIALITSYLFVLSFAVVGLDYYSAAVKAPLEFFKWVLNILLRLATGKDVTLREFSWRMVKWYGYLVLFFGGLLLLDTLPNMLKFFGRLFFIPVNLLLLPILTYFQGAKREIEQYEMTPLNNDGIEARICELCGSRWLRLEKSPTLWVSQQPLASPAMAFGSHRESHLCLSPEVLEDYPPDSNELKAILLHELAHIKSGDLALTAFLTSLLKSYYALCGLFTFVILLSSLMGAGSMVGKIIVLIIPFFSFGLMCDLLIRSAQRYREKAADIRSALCLGERAAMQNVLSTVDEKEADDALTMDIYFSIRMQFAGDGATSKKQGFWSRLWNVHPPVSERLAMFQNINEKAFQVSNWTLILVGLVSTFVLLSAFAYFMGVLELVLPETVPKFMLRLTFVGSHMPFTILFSFYFLLNTLRPSFLLPKNRFLSLLKSIALFEFGFLGGMTLYFIIFGWALIANPLIAGPLLAIFFAFLHSLIAFPLASAYSAVCRHATKALPDISMFQRQLRKAMRMLLLWFPLLIVLASLVWLPLLILSPIVWVLFAAIYLIRRRRRTGFCPHCHAEYRISSLTIQWPTLSHICSSCGQDIYYEWYHTKSVPIASPAPSHMDVEQSLQSLAPAGFFRRAAALVFDLLFLHILLVCLAAIYSFWAKVYGLYFSLFWMIWPGTFGHLFYFMIGNSWGRQTLGKKLMGIQTQKSDGTALTKKRSLLRYFAYFLAVVPFGLGFFSALWDRHKQGWHDKLIKSQVVQVKPVRPFLRYLAVTAFFILHLFFMLTLFA